jgi:predicted ester cyclase
MENEATKQLASRFYEDVLNAGNLELLDQLLSQNFVDHVVGLDAFKDFLRMVTGAFPDIHIHVEDIVAEGNKAAVRLAIHGTHKGTLMGSIDPTGKAAKWTGIDIVEIAEGKIAARWSERDLLGLMQQLGVVQLP